MVCPAKFALILFIAVEVVELQNYCNDLFHYFINWLNSFKITWRLSKAGRTNEPAPMDQ